MKFAAIYMSFLPQAFSLLQNKLVVFARRILIFTANWAENFCRILFFPCRIPECLHIKLTFPLNFRELLLIATVSKGGTTANLL